MGVVSVKNWCRRINCDRSERANWPCPNQGLRLCRRASARQSGKPGANWSMFLCFFSWSYACDFAGRLFMTVDHDLWQGLAEPNAVTGRSRRGEPGAHCPKARGQRFDLLFLFGELGVETLLLLRDSNVEVLSLLNDG